MASEGPPRAEVIRVWLFFDDVHLMISKCGVRLGRCVWSA
jgi:hypothetical protein